MIFSVCLNPTHPFLTLGKFLLTVEPTWNFKGQKASVETRRNHFFLPLLSAELLMQERGLSFSSLPRGYQLTQLLRASVIKYLRVLGYYLGDLGSNPHLFHESSIGDLGPVTHLTFLTRLL